MAMINKEIEERVSEKIEKLPSDETPTPELTQTCDFEVE